MRENTNANRVLVARPEEKAITKTYKWEDNTTMNLRETGWDGMNCIKLDHDKDQWWALVNTIMNLQII
jgi:hypothetical protein